MNLGDIPFVPFQQGRSAGDQESISNQMHTLIKIGHTELYGLVCLVIIFFYL